jgi:hypothetical protein
VKSCCRPRGRLALEVSMHVGCFDLRPSRLKPEYSLRRPMALHASTVTVTIQLRPSGTSVTKGYSAILPYPTYWSTLPATNPTRLETWHALARARSFQPHLKFMTVTNLSIWTCLPGAKVQRAQFIQPGALHKLSGSSYCGIRGKSGLLCGIERCISSTMAT